MKIACDWGDMPEVPREDYDEEKSDRAYKGCFWSLVLSIVTFVIVSVLLLTSCTTTEYVPVVQTNTEHHWHTDSVRERDSTHTERKTIIRELDSAAMARYGIQMESNQRAWLVLQREMENRLRELEHMTAQRDTVHDSIPVPYPVETIKEVPAELSWWQKLRLWLGNIVLLVLLAVVVYYGYRFYKVWRFRL